LEKVDDILTVAMESWVGLLRNYVHHDKTRQLAGGINQLGAKHKSSSHLSVITFMPKKR
jgi:hypothetical protein